MKKLSFILTIMIGLGLSSCSVGRYVNPSQNLNLNQTQVVLSKANFKVVKHVSKSIIYTQKYLTFRSDQLYQSAYAELVKMAHLTGSQVLINVTIEAVERVSGVWWPKSDFSVTVSGIVIEFLDENDYSPQAHDETVLYRSTESTKDGGTIRREKSKTTPTASSINTDESLLLLKELLNKYKSATFSIEGTGITSGWLNDYTNQFLNTFNNQISQSNLFRLTTSPKNLNTKLIITNKDGDSLSAYIEIKDTISGLESSIDLGTDNIQNLAKTFARVVRYNLSK